MDLIPVVKDAPVPTFTRTGVKMQCWGATSVDGVWRFERVEDVGTLWETVYTPDPNVRCPLASTLNNARWEAATFGADWINEASNGSTKHEKETA